MDLVVLLSVGLTLIRPLVSGLLDDASVLDAALASWLAGAVVGVVMPLAVSFAVLVALWSATRIIRAR